ncbi:MAG: hypothetical protein WHS77_07660 [Brevinematales bacterium]
MIILHGFYDEGKIEILEKDLPKVKGEVEIIIKEKRKLKDRIKTVKGLKINTTFDRETIYEEEF